MTAILPYLLGTLDFIKRYLWQIALVLSLLANWNLYSSRETWKARATAEIAAHQQTKDDYKKAQQEALAKAEAEKQQKEAEYEAAKNHADKSYADLAGKYHAAVMRLQSAEAIIRSSSGTGVPGTTGGSEGSHRPYQDAIVLEREDALICAENQSRLEIIQDWWKSIQETPEP